jgi:hypothetical protein
MEILVVSRKDAMPHTYVATCFTMARAPHALPAATAAHSGRDLEDDLFIHILNLDT